MGLTSPSPGSTEPRPARSRRRAKAEEELLPRRRADVNQTNYGATLGSEAMEEKLNDQSQVAAQQRAS